MHIITPMNFAHKVRAILDNYRLTPAGLAAQIGVPNTTVGRWLRGQTPQRMTALKLADAFGWDVDDLLNETKDAPGEKFGDLIATLKGDSTQAAAIFPNNPEARQVALDFQLAQRTDTLRNKKIAEQLRGMADELDPPASAPAAETPANPKTRAKPLGMPPRLPPPPQQSSMRQRKTHSVRGVI